MPPLAKILEALRTARYAENADKLGSLGRVFQQASEANPGYFQVPGRTPTANLDVLSAKHGIPLSIKDIQTASGAHSTTLRSRVPGQMSLMYDSGDTPATMKERALDLNLPDEYKLWASSIKRGELTPNTKIFNIDTSDVRMGTGTAKRTYPAFWEWILAHPDAANEATSLSMNNIVRRTPNMAGVLEKFGQRAGDRIRINNDQIAPLGAASREAEYHGLPVSQQIGLLNAISAPHTEKVVNNRLRMLQMLASEGHEVPEQTLAEMRSLKLDDPYQPWTPSTDVDADYFPRLSELLKGSPGEPQQAGVDSLRRAAITYDHLGKGLTAKDIEFQPWLTTGIARKAGGLIPARTPGALTRTCGCGG